MNKYFIFLILLLFTLNWQLTSNNVDSSFNKTNTQTENHQQNTKNSTSNKFIIKALSHYPKQDPSSNAPLLEWTEDLNAVYYELELFATIPDDLTNDKLSSQHLYYTATIYTCAKQLDLTKIAPEYLNGTTPLYWRVRSMDIDGNPITNFSALEEIYANNTPSSINSPIPHVIYNEGNGTTLLYPVYSFIPNANATKFEVEVTDNIPENPNGIEPSRYRIFSKIISGGELYDEAARIGTYYWRVRGLDDEGNPVGVYCDAQIFRNEPSDSWEIGIFGDSISHGGGHLSFGPADWAYSYAYYLDFPTINLSCSGDTSATMVERFDNDVLPFHPKYLLIMGGSNSLRAGVPADSVIHDLKTIQEKCYANGITPILLTLAPINPENIKKVFNEETADVWQDNFRLVNDFIRTQPHIDTAKALNSPPILPTYYAMDGLHGDVPAKKIYAQEINDNFSHFLTK